MAEYQPLIATGAGVAALLALILWARMNAFVALILVAIFSAIAGGMAPEAALDTVIAGMGGTLGFIAVVIGLGALFGAMLEASGGVTMLADSLMRNRSVATGRWAMAFIGLMASIPVFFDVAIIILAPLVFATAKSAGRPAMSFGLPLMGGLVVAHSFIPPTPGPIAVAQIIGADLASMIFFGLIAGGLAAAVAGPLYASLLDRLKAMPASNRKVSMAHAAEATTPVMNAGATAAVIVLPLVLILGGTLAKTLIAENSAGAAGFLRDCFALIGHPFVALIIACGAAFLFFRNGTPAQKERLSAGLSRALEPTGAVILVTGAGGAFKQVLVESGAGGQLAEAALGAGMTPLVAAYVLTLLIRVAQGSATVAMITGAGLTAPFAQAAGLEGPDLALLALACAAGASALSHVNDSGFWLVSRLFGLTPNETLRTWTVTSTLASVVGFAGICLISLVV
jgi:Gnt-I system low-affinity gluconate transporter